MTRRSIIQFVVVTLIVIAGVFGARAIASAQGTNFKAKFEATVGLYPGNDVQILGVRVGTVTAVEPTGSTVTVSMKLNKDVKVAADTRAVIIAPTLVSDRFVQLTEPYQGGEALKEGTVIDASKTAVPVEIDDLYGSLIDSATKLGPDGANKDGALSRLLEVAAKNLDGQGADINRMIEEFGRASATLAETGDDFFATLSNFKEFNDMLVANDSALSKVNQQFAFVADYLADERHNLAEAVAELGDALSVVDDFIDDNRSNMQASVENLIGPTQVLVKQKDSLEESVRLIPLLLQNFLNAYNPGTRTVDGRGNMNEISIWSKDGLNATTSDAAPPVLLPGLGDSE